MMIRPVQYSAMLLCLFSHDHSFLLCLWLGLAGSRMFPSSLLLDPPRLERRPLELVSLVYWFREMSTPTNANHGQHKWSSLMAQGCAEDYWQIRP